MAPLNFVEGRAPPIDGGRAGDFGHKGDVDRVVRLIRFRRFRSSSLALASLDPACRDHRPDVSATLTTVAFDHSRSRWLGINDLIAEPEGPSFISSTVAPRRVDRRCS
jgi:hypothetical protein